MKAFLLTSSWTRVATVLAALVVWGGPAVAGNGDFLVLDVVADPGKPNIVPRPTTGLGPFYFSRAIIDPGTGDLVGKFHCSGFFVNDGALKVVNQEYDLFDRGMIQVQGIEGENPQAVTGGTGEFDSARGAVTGVDLNSFPKFTVIFRLLGTGDM